MAGAPLACQGRGRNNKWTDTGLAAASDPKRTNAKPNKRHKRWRRQAAGVDNENNKNKKCIINAGGGAVGAAEAAAGPAADY